MIVELYPIHYVGETGIRITVENAYSPWVLTIRQAKELHEQLGAVLWEAGEIDELQVEYRAEEA